MGRAAEFDADFSALFLQEFPRLARTVHHIVEDRARAEELGDVGAVQVRGADQGVVRAIALEEDAGQRP